MGACTYCKTVQARGKLGSYAPDAIVERVNQAVGEGVKEIWLTSEDTGNMIMIFVFKKKIIRGLWKRYKYEYFIIIEGNNKESTRRCYDENWNDQSSIYDGTFGNNCRNFETSECLRFFTCSSAGLKFFLKNINFL